MARPKIHELDFGPYRSIPKPYRMVQYGECTRAPYAENNLWFVTINRGTPPEYQRARSPLLENDHTFIVGREYAKSVVFDEWYGDIGKWGKVAHEVFQGFWCPHYECLSEDVPVFVHQLPSGQAVKYGYCRAQSINSPERELWFVAFQNGSTYVVDFICANPDFIDRMGDSTLKWEIICWCKLEHEVVWDKLETGSREGGYVRSNSSFSFDSPCLPFSLEDIEVRISNFEREIPKMIDAYKLDGGRGLFSRNARPDWSKLDRFDQLKYIRSWEKQTGDRIVTFG